ncbi:MAG: YihA family ribosome biogenesis GTP-binding protein [Candidatus Delongbacteria bacterium]|nr:YihA family ribosome biogenesis GTP-binding protein [Candidatus Delongbacteria bacterium]MBN2836666.1 YihA family ribosome biogenesis GTP-binding protein [Candidatus Delongbacteria bacterium]
MEFRIFKSEFIKSASSKEGFIFDDTPQFVFAGKSNVGKSSFINSVLVRKNLAKTSQTPGKTRLVNYFKVNDNFYFVDLPGYGYAKVPHSERDFWQKMVNKYLMSTSSITLAFSLIDIRHNPSENDINMIKMFSHYGINQVIVLSKADKVSKNDATIMVRKLKSLFQNDTVIDYIVYSSLKTTGRDKVLKAIESVLIDTDHLNEATEFSDNGSEI